MVIYADVLFLVNLIFDCTALAAVGKITKQRALKLRLLAGGAVGALGSVIIFCFGNGNVIFKILLAFLMVLCAYGVRGRKTFEIFAAFLLVNAAVSGAVSVFISVFSSGTDSVIKNGIIYFDISGKLLFVILLAAYPAVCLLFRIIRLRRAKGVYLTKIERSGKEVSLNALFDSGNTLREPVTGRPVIVAEWAAVRDLFESQAEFNELPEKIEEYRLMLIPYHALGKKNGRIFAFRADKIEVDERVTEHVFVGVTDESFSGEYSALLNAELI